VRAHKIVKIANKNVKNLSKKLSKVVKNFKKLSKFVKKCQKVQKVDKKLSKSSLKKAKIAKYFEVEDETCGRRIIKKKCFLGTRTKSSVSKIATFLSIVMHC
jgi:hypothetical protein